MKQRARRMEEKDCVPNVSLPPLLYHHHVTNLILGWPLPRVGFIFYTKYTERYAVWGLRDGGRVMLLIGLFD